MSLDAREPAQHCDLDGDRLLPSICDLQSTRCTGEGGSLLQVSVDIKMKFPMEVFTPLLLKVRPRKGKVQKEDRC